MTELTTRTLNDGSGTTVTMFWDGADAFVVEAVNVNGSDRMECTRQNVNDVYWHPFCNEARMDYPTETENAVKLAAHQQSLLDQLNRNADREDAQ